MDTPVYASRVSGLSDARYFSGMGVRWLGIVALDGLPGYMAPERFREIAGWVAGVEFVLEVDVASVIPDFQSITEKYGPAKFLISPSQVDAAVTAGISFGIRCSAYELKTIVAAAPELVLTEGDGLHLETTFSFPVLIDSNHSPESMEPWLRQSAMHGVWVSSSAEEKPGLKEYPSASILEWLDERSGG